MITNISNSMQNNLSFGNSKNVTQNIQKQISKFKYDPDVKAFNYAKSKEGQSLLKTINDFMQKIKNKL